MQCDDDGHGIHSRKVFQGKKHVIAIFHVAPVGIPSTHKKNSFSNKRVRVALHLQ